MLQGNLADPLYFDFISCAQFATLSEAMETGRQEFEVRLLSAAHFTVPPKPPASGISQCSACQCHPWVQLCDLRECLMRAAWPPPQEYCEDCDTRYRTVRRDPELSNNRLLPGAFQARAASTAFSAHAALSPYPLLQADLLDMTASPTKAQRYRGRGREIMLMTNVHTGCGWG